MLPHSKDTTHIVSANPLVAISDTRYEDAPCFLYLPVGRADTVVVDYRRDILSKVAEWPIWSLPDDSLASLDKRPYNIEVVPDKGKGMVARREIRAGELIWSERPIYAARRTLTCAADQTDTNGVFYRAALQRLSPRSKEAFFALASAYPPAEFDIVPGILNTNCLEICMSDAESDEHHDPAEDSYAGLFPTLSRVNHSCTPSANYFFAFPTFSGQLWAAHDIAVGEEITITYTPLTAPRIERRAFLARTRFFVCACPACIVPPRQAEASDARRIGMCALLERLQHTRFPPCVSQEELEQALEWTEDEKMMVERAKVLLYGSQVLTVYGELRTAMDWAMRARDAFRMVEGEGSCNVRRLDDADRVHGSDLLKEQE
ncbi:SET domain-containing protein 5 [Trametes pubescens]|uniref:SET domain-containing protein 5 n=1 Tax=Trametes pubescens TaxID=154538 RepID=A0A1M2VJ99_TRAPU|nr:SET domain-containing protein 5 [Trametes pubescens]